MSADLCTLARVLLAPLFAWLLAGTDGATTSVPLVVFAVAVASDVADGRLARAHGHPSPAGRLFDHGADVFFVLPALVVLASTGRVPLLLPCAVAVAFALYGLDGWRRGHEGARVLLAPSPLGTVTGVGNYAVAGVAAASLALGARAAAPALFAAGLAAATLNVLCAVDRVQRLLRVPRALATGEPAPRPG